MRPPHSMRCLLRGQPRSISAGALKRPAPVDKPTSEPIVSVPHFLPDSTRPDRCNAEGWSDEDYNLMSQQGAEYHLPEKQLRYGGVMDYGDERVSVQLDGLRLVEEVEKRG